jgi:DNA-3-methyladenine glycosylase
MFSAMQRLQQDFFIRPTLQVAQELLGKLLVFQQHQGYITETEAYIGKDDPACHAARGKTPRTAVMFGEAGYSYVYFIYGKYYCLNIVTEAKGFPAAVLIRGVLDTHSGSDINGPGKLCRNWGITTAHNIINIARASDFFIANTDFSPSFSCTPRIGISVGGDKLWRFVVDRPFSFPL